jgi:hypothetical protein
MLWRTDLDVEEEGELRIQIMSPDKSMIDIGEGPKTKINLMGVFKHFRARTNFQGIPYTGNGVYRFLVQLRTSEAEQWETVAQVPLEVNLERNLSE